MRPFATQSGDSTRVIAGRPEVYVRVGLPGECPEFLDHGAKTDAADLGRLFQGRNLGDGTPNHWIAEPGECGRQIDEHTLRLRIGLQQGSNRRARLDPQFHWAAPYGRRIVLQQSPFAFERADVADVLRDLQRAEILAGAVADRKVADVYEPAGELNPEFGYAFPSFAEVVQDPIHHIDAARRMAVLHLPADDGPAAREDAVRAFREEGHAVVRIHESEIHREGGEDGGELFERQIPGRQRDAVIRPSENGPAPPAGDILREVPPGTSRSAATMPRSRPTRPR